MTAPAVRVYPTAPPDPPPPAEWEWLLGLLPVDVEASARAHGALRRRRRVASGAALLRLALAYALVGRSLRATGAWAVLAGTANLSAEALGKRLRRSRAWLGALVAALVAADRPAGAGRAVRLRVVDASLVQRPGRRGGDLRLHLSLDLGRERIDGLELTDVRGGETLLRYAAQPGDILLADAGHSHRRGLADLLGRGAHAIVRYAWQSLPLRTPAGEPLGPEALAARLGSVPPAGLADWPVAAGPAGGPTLPLRLVAGRLPPDAAERRRARLRRQARKKERPVPRSSLALADWLLVVTSLPAAVWPPSDVLALYRVRWQVELVFKRLKGLWDLGDLPTCGDDLAQAIVLARLLAALLADRATHPRPADDRPRWTDTTRPLSRWRWQALLRQLLTTAVAGPLAFVGFLARLPDLDRFLRDSPRRRPSQLAHTRAAFDTPEHSLQQPIPHALSPPHAA